MKRLPTDLLRRWLDTGTQPIGWPLGELIASVVSELIQRREDEVAAAGELAVALPIPGSDAAKMLAAARMFNAQVVELAEERDRARHMLNVIDKLGDCECGGRIIPRSVDWAMCTTCFDETYPISDWAAGHIGKEKLTP